MALTQVYEQVRVTGLAASTQGRGRFLCRLRDQTYALCYLYDNTWDEIRVSIGTGIGSSWTEEVAVPVVGGIDIWSPSLAVDSRDNLHLCYQTNLMGAFPAVDRVYYTRRDHVTHAWSTPLEIGGSSNSYDPVLAVGPDDQVSVVWTDSNSGHVCYRERSYSAGTWSAIGTLDNPVPAAGGHHNYPAIAYDTLGNLHIATQAHGYGAFPAMYQLIYMRRNSDGTMGTQIQVSDANVDSVSPNIFVDLNNNLHVFCEYSSGGYDAVWRKKQLDDAAFQAMEGIKPDMSLPTSNPSAAISQDQCYHVGFTCAWGGENYGIYIANRHYSDHAWWYGHWIDTSNAPYGVGHRYNLALTADPSHPQLMWAMFPYVNGVHTNIPLTGCAMVFSDDTAQAVYFFTFSGHGYYNGAWGCWEPWWDDTLTLENTTEVADGPDIETLPATAIGQDSAVLNGVVNDDQGIPCDVCFEYGLTDTYGKYTELQPGKVSGNGISARIGELQQGTTYHCRIKALWGTQAFYGNDIAVTARAPETVLRADSGPSISALALMSVV